MTIEELVQNPKVMDDEVLFRKEMVTGELQLHSAQGFQYTLYQYFKLT